MPLTVEAAREADRAEAQLLLLRMGIAQCLNGGYANGATWLGTIHGQAAWSRLRLAVSGARGSRLEPTPPSVGGSVRRPQQVPPRWGRFFGDKIPLVSRPFQFVAAAAVMRPSQRRRAGVMTPENAQRRLSGI